MMIKLQDFARECGVTDRAIQKHIQKHEEALQGHFERRGVNGTWLDDFAQEFIRNLMVQSPPAVVSDSRLMLENEDLQKQLTQRDAKIEALQELLDKAMAENSRLSSTVGRLEGSDAAHKLLEDNLRKEADTRHLEATEARRKREEAETRANALEVTLARQKARERALMARGLFARLVNKEVEV